MIILNVFSKFAYKAFSLVLLITGNTDMILSSTKVSTLNCLGTDVVQMKRIFVIISSLKRPRQTYWAFFEIWSLCKFFIVRLRNLVEIRPFCKFFVDIVRTAICTADCNVIEYYDIIKTLLAISLNLLLRIFRFKCIYVTARYYYCCWN